MEATTILTRGAVDGPFESSRIQVQALVVQNLVDAWSHHAGQRSLSQWLADEQVPGLTGIDTRTLTRLLRERGTMRGWLHAPATAGVRHGVREVDMREEVFRLVAPGEPVLHEAGDRTVLLVDVGAKDNLVRSMLDRGIGVLRAPWFADLGALARRVDGVLIGNGPGDPKDLMPLVAHVRGLMALSSLPIFGVCLGHQILALAAGADTFKLPYGHRGVNQPVQDLFTRRCLVTSQNHGYAVDDASLPTGWEPWLVNLNDGTNEGLRASESPHCSVQFHPEAQPGPRDAAHLFDEFVRLLAGGGRRRRRAGIEV